MRHRIITLSLATGFFAAGVVLAQVEVQPGTPATSIAPTPIVPIAPPTPTTAISTAPATSQDSAEAYLQNLLRDKGTLGTTGPAMPSVIATTGPKPEANGLLREGQQLMLRSGHLKKDESGNSIFIF